MPNPKQDSILLTEGPYCGAAVRATLHYVVCTVLSLLAFGIAHPQAPSPVPSDFASAKTAFIASGGVPALGTREKLAVGMLYNSFYQKLATWNKYKVVSTPKDADIAFELSIAQAVGPVNLGVSFATTYIKVDARDVKTHALLWTIDDPIDGAFRVKTFRRDVDQGVDLVIADLKALAAGKQPGSAPDTAPSTQP